jgi:hypothetical protein
MISSIEVKGDRNAVDQALTAGNQFGSFCLGLLKPDNRGLKKETKRPVARSGAWMVNTAPPPLDARRTRPTIA